MLSSPPSFLLRPFQAPALRRRMATTLWLVLLLAFGPHCASLNPPLEATDARQQPGLQIEILRSDPDGLHFVLRAEDAAVDDDIEIWRAHRGQWDRLQIISIDEELLTPLRQGNAQWHDPLDEPPGTYHYRLRQIGSDESWVSATTTAEWNQAPDAPDPEATVTEATSPRVSLFWNGERPMQTRILRRDVLVGDDFSPLATVDPAADGQFDDLGVEPGGVYAYQLQYIDRMGAFPRFGLYSQELYVAVPD